MQCVAFLAFPAVKLGSKPSVRRCTAEDGEMQARPKSSVFMSRGFTLIEMMVTVAVAAILGAVALPGFLSQLAQGRRTDAIEALMTLQQSQETWRGAQPSYAASLSALGLAATSRTGDYSLALLNVTATGYTARATAVAGRRQAADTACTILSLTVDGGSLNTTPAICWKR